MASVIYEAVSNTASDAGNAIADTTTETACDIGLGNCSDSNDNPPDPQQYTHVLRAGDWLATPISTNGHRSLYQNIQGSQGSITRCPPGSVVTGIDAAYDSRLNELKKVHSITCTPEADINRQSHGNSQTFPVSRGVDTAHSFRTQLTCTENGALGGLSGEKTQYSGRGNIPDKGIRRLKLDCRKPDNTGTLPGSVIAAREQVARAAREAQSAVLNIMNTGCAGPNPAFGCSEEDIARDSMRRAAEQMRAASIRLFRNRSTNRTTYSDSVGRIMADTATDNATAPAVTTTVTHCVADDRVVGLDVFNSIGGVDRIQPICVNKNNLNAAPPTAEVTAQTVAAAQQPAQQEMISNNRHLWYIGGAVGAVLLIIVVVLLIIKFTK